MLLFRKTMYIYIYIGKNDQVRNHNDIMWSKWKEKNEKNQK